MTDYWEMYSPEWWADILNDDGLRPAILTTPDTATPLPATDFEGCRQRTSSEDVAARQAAIYQDYLDHQRRAAHIINLEWVDPFDREHDGFTHPDDYYPPF